MITLPKVKKSARTALTGWEAVRKVVLGVALVSGMGLASLSSNDAAATVGAGPTANAVNLQGSGSLVLRPAVPTGADTQVADHYSHSSHYSHGSHGSHHSHYSSRY